MATIIGTTSNDTLVGTSGDDIFLAYGITGLQSPDWMSGGNGNDIYDLREAIGNDPVHHYIIDDNGTDGGADRIENAGALIHITSNGYVGFTSAIRDGDDLIIVTPYKPHQFRDPALPSYEITIIDHYAGEAVETLVAGGVTYTLASGSIGGAAADIMAGTNFDDVYKGKGGDDYMVANDGNDQLFGGAGDDYLFGGAGNDILKGNAGDDIIYAGVGNDVVKGGSGTDQIYLEAGNDKGIGGAGDDFLYGQEGNNRLVGSAGWDTLSGGTGNDVMIGGADGDIYRYVGYDVIAGDASTAVGHDTIIERGEAVTYGNVDILQLLGFSGSSSNEAFSRIGFERNGQNMKIVLDGGTGSVTVRNQFGAERFVLEELHLADSFLAPFQFKIRDGAKDAIGDDRGSTNAAGGQWNEVLFGTDGDDRFFGDSGVNFYWLGGGSDTLIYKETGPFFVPGGGGGPVSDHVMDFDIAMDAMDFSEITNITMADLLIGENSDGHATIDWASPDTQEISNIHIELRGVTAVELTADHFIF